MYWVRERVDDVLKRCVCTCASVYAMMMLAARKVRVCEI